MTSENLIDRHGIGGGADLTQQRRFSARGTCFWYQALHVAQAKASCRYRIGHFVELVSGANAVVAPRLPAEVVSGARTVCCVRPLLEPPLAKALSVLRRSGTRLIADYDDLLFAGDVSGLPASVGGSQGPKQRAARLANYAAALAEFDAFTVSTRALERRLSQLAPRAPVTCIPNGLSEAWVRQGRALYRSFQPGDPLVIRYFAGSPSHDEDFASVVGPLIKFLVDYPQTRLEVVGPVRVDARLFPVGRFAALPSEPYEALPRLIASSWVNLAPLRSNEFNECKSAIKLLEAGAFNCPTIASPTDDITRHRELGAPVLVCRTEDDWYVALQALLDLPRRMALGHASADHVARHGMARSNVRAWLDIVHLGSAS